MPDVSSLHEGPITPLRSTIRAYLRKAENLKEFFKANPNEWSRIQGEFDEVVQLIGLNVVRFERENVNNEQKVYKMKRLFSRKLRRHFLEGEFVPWCWNKPYGYPGDFVIIDAIYSARPRTNGYGRLFDEHFLGMAAAVATRNRKEDFKRIIGSVVDKTPSLTRVMDLASGPCRDLKEFFDENPDKVGRVSVDCYDFDENAITFGAALMSGLKNVKFFKRNALRLALKKDIKSEIADEYNLIFSTGLFDYLDDGIAIKLLHNLKTVLKKDGVMAISNYKEKQHNPSAYLMEWVADWNLIYRSENEFRQMFLRAGFREDQLTIRTESQGVMQYCLASNS